MSMRGTAPKPFDTEEEAERLINEIEGQFPPERCTLEQYRDVLDTLEDLVRSRVRQLDDEIG